MLFRGVSRAAASGIPPGCIVRHADQPERVSVRFSENAVNRELTLIG